MIYFYNLLHQLETSSQSYLKEKGSMVIVQNIQIICVLPSERGSKLKGPNKTKRSIYDRPF